MQGDFILSVPKTNVSPKYNNHIHQVDDTHEYESQQQQEQEESEQKSVEINEQLLLTNDVLFPMTIRQVQRCENSSSGEYFTQCSSRRVSVTHVKIVGKVIAWRLCSLNNLMFIMSDGTAAIGVFVVLPAVASPIRDENGEECQDINPMSLNLPFQIDDYVNVIGSLRYFSTESGFPKTHWHVNAERLSLVRKVQDYNSITHHFLECMHLQTS